MSEQQAQCAHVRVTHRTTGPRPGLVTGSSWKCDSCETEFTLKAALSRERAAAVEECAKVCDEQARAWHDQLEKERGCNNGPFVERAISRHCMAMELAIALRSLSALPLEAAATPTKPVAITSVESYCEGYEDGAHGSVPKTDAATLRPFPALFAIMYARLVEVARVNGYALTIHGSLARDLDVVAVPWTDEAAEPFALVDALRERVGGIGHNGWPTPHARPHGRLTWTIHLGGGPYIDVSVTPHRHVEALESPAQEAQRNG